MFNACSTAFISCLMYVQQACFLQQGILQGCNQMCAGYLFQQDKQYDITYDTGDKAIQCGRHVDIFKFWLMWKAKVNNEQNAEHFYRNLTRCQFQPIQYGFKFLENISKLLI